ncbi:SIR2 family protein [Gordonia sp. DT218]|uniref:SIR2 family protein n=1 Tax=Gordonia sp. DT218 TaxID=3416659 RepID=UPI003CF3B484
MTNTGNRVPGHLFVVQGLIQKIRFDAVVVPTDDWFNVKSYWHPLFGGVAPAKPVNWTGGYQRANERSSVWFVSVNDGQPVRGPRLTARVRKLVADIADVAERPDDRALPLIAVPVLGIGKGGQSDERGEVIRLLVETLRKVAREHCIDVVLVTNEQAAFSAVQHLRRAGNGQGWELSDAELDVARDVGDQAQQGQLAVLLGAGVSIAAGLPSWGELLTELARHADLGEETFNSLNGSPLDQAELIAQKLGSRLGSLVAEIARRADRVSLAHALVAGMDCQEAVTTNYDRLYEDAVEFAGRSRPSLLPWEPVEGNRSWILKMHGDVERPDSIVLTRRSFVRYDATFRPAGSLLQALMMTRHLLVIGTSMTDDNVIRLAVEVDDFISRAKQFGTFIDVSGAPVRAQLWAGRFRWHVCAGEKPAERVRQMEIFLDAVATFAARDASWLLDDRFAGLLTPEESDCTETALRAYQSAHRSDSRLLLPLRDGLATFGADRSKDPRALLLTELRELPWATSQGRRAPYKHVLLVWAITRAQQGNERLAVFSEVRSELADLLLPFRVGEEAAPKPSDPWERLNSSMWWEFRVTDEAGVVIANYSKAGLSREAWSEVTKDDAFANEAIEELARLVIEEVGDSSGVEQLLRSCCLPIDRPVPDGTTISSVSSEA